MHRGRTTAGYSSRSNETFDNQLVHNSPFSLRSMAEPDYLSVPYSASFGIVKGVAFADYAWLYMTVHDLRHVVLHEWPEAIPGNWAGVARFKAQLAGGTIFEDGMTAVYERDLLKPPGRPVLLCTTGWRGGWHGRDVDILPRLGSLAFYNPSSREKLVFTLTAQAFRKARTVRLMAGETELARWAIAPAEMRRYESPPFLLPTGLGSLTIESDGEQLPLHKYEGATRSDMRPYSLVVNTVSLRSVLRDSEPPYIARSLDAEGISTSR
jgi:hypothetical protein